MPSDIFLQQRLICVAVIDQPDDAVPLAEALSAGGLLVIEVTFRTSAATEAIANIRQHCPQMSVGAGTLLNAEQVSMAVDAGAQFGVSPGLSEVVSNAAHDHHLPLYPGVSTPTEVMRALDLGWQRLKFFPAAAAGGEEMLRALAGPFAHTGVKFIPTGGITPGTLPNYLAVPQVAAVGGSWMADRRMIADQSWGKITAITANAMEIVTGLKVVE